MVTVSKTGAALGLLTTALILFLIYYSVVNSADGDYDRMRERMDSMAEQQLELLEKVTVLEERVSDVGLGELTLGSTSTSQSHSDKEHNLKYLEDKLARLNNWVSDIDYQVGELSKYAVVGEASNHHSTQAKLEERFKSALEQQHLEGTRDNERLHALQTELNQESVDQNWALQAEIAIEQAFARPELAAASLLSTDCRTNLCEIRYSLDPNDKNSETAVNLELPTLLSKSFSHMRMVRDRQGISDVHIVYARKK